MQPTLLCKKLCKKILIIVCISALLAGCETIVVRDDAPSINKKRVAPKNSDKIITESELDNSASANYQMAYSYYSSKEFDAAFEKIQLVLKRYPKFPNAYNLLGLLEQGRGRIDAASANFKKAFELNPLLAEAYSNYSRIACSGGTLDTVAASGKGNTQAGLYTASAECSLRNGAYPAALASLETANRINPNYGQAYFIKAIVLGQTNNWSGAETALDQYHNINGYTNNSLGLGLELGRRSGSPAMLQKYQAASNQFLGVN
ncbi:hypothetical protein AwWohl_11920 [Gammaproteobacteria bacterium]|nr:hypothetical protein AwWohl_11920 [Gammaproteobacteria bacterium]